MPLSRNMQKENELRDQKLKEMMDKLKNNPVDTKEEDEDEKESE